VAELAAAVVEAIEAEAARGAAMEVMEAGVVVAR